jgi:hypothetical protein
MGWCVGGFEVDCSVDNGPTVMDRTDDGVFGNFEEYFAGRFQLVSRHLDVEYMQTPIPIESSARDEDGPRDTFIRIC